MSAIRAKMSMIKANLGAFSFDKKLGKMSFYHRLFLKTNAGDCAP